MSIRELPQGKRDSRVVAIASLQQLIKMYTQNLKYLKLKIEEVQVVKEAFKEARQKECYNNAFKYTMRNLPCTYVLGYVIIHGVPISHAWVKKNNTHMDVTLDPAKQHGYVKVLEVPMRLLSEYIMDEGHAPSITSLNIFVAESRERKKAKAATEISAPGETMTFLKWRFRIDWIEQRIATNQVRFRREKEDITYWATKILGLKRDKPEHRPASLFMRIDYDHLKTITPERLKEPIIMVESPHGGIVVDGNHRLAKAYMQGIDEMEMYIIPESEFKKIMEPPKQRMRIKGNEIKPTTRYEKLQSLAAEFRKLKCKAEVKGTQLLPTLAVVSTKYPFNWCLKKLGWIIDTSKTKLMSDYYVVREDGSFPMQVAWRGTNYLKPIGDWEGP